jgi:hypothetical protein
METNTMIRPLLRSLWSQLVLAEWRARDDDRVGNTADPARRDRDGTSRRGSLPSSPHS